MVILEAEGVFLAERAASLRDEAARRAPDWKGKAVRCGRLAGAFLKRYWWQALLLAGAAAVSPLLHTAFLVTAALMVWIATTPSFKLLLGQLLELMPQQAGADLRRLGDENARQNQQSARRDGLNEIVLKEIEKDSGKDVSDDQRRLGGSPLGGQCFGQRALFHTDATGQMVGGDIAPRDLHGLRVRVNGQDRPGAQPSLRPNTMYGVKWLWPSVSSIGGRLTGIEELKPTLASHVGLSHLSQAYLAPKCNSLIP
jgi:hypothetical protein